MSYAELMQKVAHAAPKHYDFLLKTAEEVKTSPFKDEITSELDGLMKKAFQMPGWANTAGKGLAGGAMMVGGAVAAGIAYSLAGDMYDAAKRGITKTRNYQAMLSANPDLKEMPSKNVQKAFSVLHRFNPDFASDPTVAGAWVKRQANFGDDAFADTSQLKNLVDARKALGESRKLPQVPRFDPMEPSRNREEHAAGLNKAFNEDSRNEERHKQQMRGVKADAERAEHRARIYKTNFPTP